MDAKKKRERSLFRDLLIVICLCVPFVIVALLKAVISLVRKVSAYLQSEWERFNDLYFGDGGGAEQQIDPALIAHIKGEGPVPGEQCPQTTAGNAESRHFKQTTQQTNKAAYNRKRQNNISASKQQKVGLIKIQSPPPPVEELTLKNANVRRAENVASPLSVLSDQQTVAGEHYNISSRKDTRASKEVKRKPKFNLHFLRAVNVLVNALLLVPRNVCTYFQRVLEDFRNIHGDDSGADLPYTEPAFIAYLKGEEGAPFIDNPHIKFSKSGSTNLENVSVDSEIAKGKSQPQGHNEKPTKGVSFVRLVKGLCCCIRGVIWDLNSRFRPLTFRPRVNAEINGTISQDISRYYNVSKEQNEDKATNFNRSHQAEKLHENASTHSGSVYSSPANVVSSEQGRLFNCFGASRTAWNARNLHTSPNTAIGTGPKLFTSSPQQAGVRTKQLNASPIVGKRAEARVKVSNKGKADSPPATRVRKDSREGMTPKKETMPPFVISSTHVDISAPTPRRTGVYTGPKLFSVPEHWNTPQTIHKPEEKPKKTNVTAGINSPAHVDISSPTTFNTVVYTGPKLFSVPESWDTPPTGSKLLEKDVKLSSEGKAHREVMSPTPFDSTTNSAAKIQEGKEKAEEKERVTPDVISPTKLDTPALTPPAEEKAKRRSMPSLIQTACKYLIGCVTTQCQEEKAPIVAHSSQMWPTNVCSDSEVLESENIKNSSTKEQIDVDPTVSRGKRAKNEEDSDKESWHAQAYIDRTENSPSECRNAKRKPERSTGPSSRSTSSRTVSRRQRHRGNEQKLETVSVSMVLPEPMEVGESPPETPFTGPPEPMETGGEQYAVVFPCGELGETNQPPVNKNFVEEEEPMEIECDESEPMEIDHEPSEAMETNQGSFLDEFSFAWENIRQTLFNQPDEEMMEIDPTSVPATPCTAQLEEIMESMREPAVMPVPFRTFERFQWPPITSMKTSEATFAVTQKATVEINQELADACKPVQTASGYVCNGDRSLGFTEEVPRGTVTALKTPDADQTVIAPVMKPVMASPLTDRVTPPPLVETETQASRKPRAPIYSEPLQSLEDKINNELAAKQSVIEPVIKPDMEPLLIERVTSPPLEEIETHPSSKPSAAIYSEHLQRMEEKLNNEPNTAAIEQQTLVAVETEEEIPATQLTMEQLQLMPELGYFPDGLDSDSDEEDSDEEYELDFATIDQFLELDAEPEHVDLINQLLTKKELASELE